ncbi:unnamed protein product [Paramecium octaurelia]|uniref:Transmembrane protein n=1 Tax=Paramecium octaurelia TaxID=43137 RepID=A0A8S1UQW1_PAROT|nr:unnamed protein product [Paramecium octaurelia]
MIIIILLVIISQYQLCQSRIFEIEDDNGKLNLKNMNGFKLQIFYSLEVQISELTQIQTSKCTQDCKDCTRRQCYLGQTELDHSEIKMYDLDTQLTVLQPLTYLNDQNQSHAINKISLVNPGLYINSFVGDGFQLCQSNTDKTLETPFLMNLKDIPNQQILFSPILSERNFNYFQINYLKFGDYQIDISSCKIYFYFGVEPFFKIHIVNEIMKELEDDFDQKFVSLLKNSGCNYFPKWIFKHIELEFEKAGFLYFEGDNQIEFKIAYRNSTNIKLDSKYDFKFFNKENEEYPIIYSSNQYLIDFKNEEQLLKFIFHDFSNIIILGASFFENKKVQFNFKENFVTIQNQFDERCFEYEKSTHYQQETLVLQVSIPLIILMALFYRINQNNEEGSEFYGGDPNKI